MGGWYGAVVPIFLSRLFGGKLPKSPTPTPQKFLSRLFGGKQKPKTASRRIYFLSRLFGGKLSTHLNH